MLTDLHLVTKVSDDLVTNFVRLNIHETAASSLVTSLSHRLVFEFG